MAKILVLGSTGMLGHMVLKVMSKEETFRVEGTHLIDPSNLFYFEVESGIDKLKLICDESNGYDYFINCIGVTTDNIDEKSSESIIRTIKINAIFPHELAEFAQSAGIRVIHISTDGVFSGNAEYYYEDAPHDCLDIYGKTKSLGEAVNSNILNIRCSIIGPSPFEKGGLFEWFQSQPEGKVVHGYTNHIWNGVSTLQFSELCKKIIKNNKFDALRKESWVFHFVPNQPISKYQLLVIFKSVLKKKTSVVPVESKDGTTRRVLKSKYRGLKGLYDQGKSMEDVIVELSKFIVK